MSVKLSDSGEILARGPNITKGYFGMEGEMNDAFSASGWFRTGDIGELDESGFLRITDRKKDLIVTSGGKNVAPQKIEGLLRSDRFISEAVVIGDNRPYLTALIVPDFERLKEWAAQEGIEYSHLKDLVEKPETRALFRERIDGVSGDLARFETIKRFTLLTRDLSQDAGELTPTRKVRRKATAQRYSSEIEGMYA